MTPKCPICGSDAGEFPRTGDFEGYDCPQHHRFDVSDTALQTRRGKASVEQWKLALERAKFRAAESRKPPMIRDHDFGP
jgi:hypothetical protein